MPQNTARPKTKLINGGLGVHGRAMKLSRLFRGFDKNDDSLQQEIELPLTVELSILQEIFGADRDDPMYDCYPVSADRAAAVEEDLGLHVPVEKYDFFLECDAVD